MLQEAEYRPDIDGLRAVAVACVVLFHAGVSLFGGGFVGVDVFFVISGFLITRIIVDEVTRTGRFSFSRFYVRRARRILPALFFTIGVSAVFAFLIYSPDQFAAFGGSMWSAAVSVSNVFFWNESGYFDLEATSKPLVHTWSLGVEEQFYALWPILVVVALRGGAKTAAMCIAIAGVVSFWLNGWFIEGRGIATIINVLSIDRYVDELGARSVFFLTPFRVFEFALGGLLVWIFRLPPPASVVREAALLTGLALIAYAVVAFDTGTRFPYFNALIPCLGTCLAIYGGGAPISGLLLRNPAIVGLGLISYSVYLLHWPVFVFYRQYTFDARLSQTEIVLLCATVLLGAALMYRFVEGPFRRRWQAEFHWRPRSVAAVAFAAAIILTIAGMTIWSGDGWTWRIPPNRITTSNAEWRKVESERYCQRWDPAKPRDLFRCQNYRGSDRDLIVWGDSHALHLVAGLSETYPDLNVYILYQTGCTPQSGFAGYVRNLADDYSTEACIDYNKRALSFLSSYRPANVMLTNAKSSTPAVIAPPTEFLIRQLRAHGHGAFVLGDFIRPGVDINACHDVPDWLLPDDALSTRCKEDQATAKKEINYSRTLAKLLGDAFLDPTDVQCRDSGRCVFVDGTAPLYRDAHHLNISGSVLLVGRLKEVLPIH